MTPKEYAAAKKELSGKPLQSNDLDLLSVALAGDATVLYSSDLPFQQDFTDPAVLPKAGGITRAVYPHERGTPKARRDFLALRKCPARL